MKGYDIYKRAMALLGYTDSDYGNSSKDFLLKRAPDIISQIAADLKCPPLVKLSDDMVLTPAKQDAICYGTAMLIALTKGDGSKNSLFAGLYNAKRAAALSSIEHIRDNLPTLGFGVD